MNLKPLNKERVFYFYEDAGHGWLAVPFEYFFRVMGGVAAQITSYSYMRGQTVYLEEDIDAGMFIQQWKRENGDIRLMTRHSERSPIRSYDSYNHSKAWEAYVAKNEARKQIDWVTP